MSDQPDYTPIPNAAIENDLITDPVLRTLAKLIKLAWRNEWKHTDWIHIDRLCQYLGMNRSTVIRHINLLQSTKAVKWITDGKNRYRFSILEMRLPLVAKWQLCDPSSSGSGSISVNSINPLLPPAKSQSCDPILILDPETWQALRDEGIGEPARTELANLPHTTAHYVHAVAADARRDGWGTGAIIGRIRGDWGAPEYCDQCKCLDGNHTRDCTARPAPSADAGLITVPVQHPAPAPESPVAAAWRQVLSNLQLQLTSATFDTWLRHTTALAYENGAYIIAAQNRHALDWLDARLRIMIERELSAVVGYEAHVTFVLNEEQHATTTN